jgi:hypothetical protein
MSKSSTTVSETIDIETSGNAVSITLEGRTTVSMAVRGDGPAEYQWDARETGGTWKRDVGKEYTGQSDYNDVLETGAQEVRLRCSTGTGTPGDEADILLMAGGG